MYAARISAAMLLLLGPRRFVSIQTVETMSLSTRQSPRSNFDVEILSFRDSCTFIFCVESDSLCQAVHDMA